MGFPPTWSCLHLPQKHSTSTGKDERKRALCNFLKFFGHLSLHHSVFISSYLLLETKLDMRCRIPSLERSSPRKGETQEPEPGHWPSVLTSLTLREQRRVQGCERAREWTGLSIPSGASRPRRAVPDEQPEH